MNAIEIEYELNGDAPYYWDTETNWSGGALPASTDMVTINNAALKTSPLIVKSGTSAVASNLVADVGTIIVEQNATLTARKGNAGGITLAKTANAVSVVTNNGTVTAYNLDLGTYGGSAGSLAQFDNFGTLTVANALRLQVKGTPSLFYNHAGATVNKTGGNEYTFYFGVDGNQKNTLVRLVNEGDFFDNTKEIWMGQSSKNYSENEIIINGNGRFFAAQNVAIGHVTDSLATITLNDSGYLSGNATWRLGGSLLNPNTYVRPEGRITLNDSSVFAASNAVLVGSCVPDKKRTSSDGYGKGTITLNDSSKMTLSSGKNFYVGYGSSSTGTVELHGNSSLTAGGPLLIGYGKSSTGTVELHGNSSITLSGAYMYMGEGNNATGSLTLTNSATMEIKTYAQIGRTAAARATISLAGDSRMYVTNSEIIVGYNNGATGVLHVAENAEFHAANLFIGQTGVAGTTGFVKISDSATLFATNICIPRWGGAGFGTLEVADNAVVTNLHTLRLATSADGNSGVGQSATLAMRGGSMFFEVDPETAEYKEHGRVNPIVLNRYISQVRGRIRGWGKIAFSDPRTYVTEADIPCGLTHYGQVIADGEGVMRDLDFSRFGALQYSNTDANPSGTNGWFAVNKGRLKLPRSLPNRSGYKCVGDCYNASVELGAGARRLANTFNYEFTGAALNNFVFSELYAVDRDDIPAGLDGLDADKVIAVWRIGYFSDGPEIDDPEHPVPFTTAKLKFKYSPLGLDGLNFVHVYRHDGTSGGEWKRCGRIVAPDTAMPVVSTRAFTPSSANWNLGWFAIVGRVERPAASIIHIR